MSGLECPYCEWDNDVEVDDSLFGGINHHECQVCEKIFTFEACVSVDYYSFRADCLNEDDCHRWIHEDYYDYSGKKTRMKCRVCETRRDMTQEEIKEMCDA